MKRKVVKAMDGEEVVFLQPENEADLQELARLDREGLLDARASFGDDPEAWGFTADDLPPEEDF